VREIEKNGKGLFCGFLFGFESLTTESGQSEHFNAKHLRSLAAFVAAIIGRQAPHS
jgi:hypothetical protein